MTNLREKGVEDGRWLELTEDKYLNYRRETCILVLLNVHILLQENSLVEGSCHGLFSVLCLLLPEGNARNHKY